MTATSLFARRQRRRARKPRVLPRQLPPRKVEKEYTIELLTIVEQIRLEFAPVLEALPELLASAAIERQDAGEGGRLRAMLAAVRERMAAIVRPSRIDELASKVAGGVSRHNKAQLGKQIRAAFGADIFATEPNLISVIETFAAENAALITNIPARVANDIEGVMLRALADATPHRTVAKQIEAQFGFTRERARLIASDQIGKLYGQINKKRQTALGVKKFIWRTSQDRRVRGTPGGAFPNARPSHHAREGVVFSYEDPRFNEERDGIPGVPIRCRCYAEPDFSDILAGL